MPLERGWPAQMALASRQDRSPRESLADGTEALTLRLVGVQSLVGLVVHGSFQVVSTDAALETDVPTTAGNSADTIDRSTDALVGGRRSTTTRPRETPTWGPES